MPVELALILALLVGAGLGLAAGLTIQRRRAPPGADAPQISPASPDFSDRLVPADQLGIGLMMLDAEGRIGAANRSAETMLGARPDALTGKSTMEAFIDHRVEELEGLGLDWPHLVVAQNTMTGQIDRHPADCHELGC